MKSVVEKYSSASESRKVRKPLMEKKRRARINDSLETLKQILLESKSTLKEASGKKSGQKTAKLEKADILEMTVRYLQQLRNKLNQMDTVESPIRKEALRKVESENRLQVTLVSTRLENGDFAFVIPSSISSNKNNEQIQINNKFPDPVWRPW